jgi:hypothetical protein
VITSAANNIPSPGPAEDQPVGTGSDSDTDADSPVEHSNGSPFEKKESAAARDWQDQKDYENASNDALDSLVAMIGLESVKNKFLNIKTKVDTVIRQGADLKDERFSAALLGNPGTGKFEETTSCL